MSDIKFDVKELELWLQSLIAEILDQDVSGIDVDSRFDRFGLDSVAAISVSESLEEHLGVEVDATVVYDHPNIRMLAKFASELAARG
jgi:acyl carrier protein